MAAPPWFLAHEQEVQDLIAIYQAKVPHATAVAELEGLVRTAVFRSANTLIGQLLQQTVDRIDAAYQPKPTEVCKGRTALSVQGMFGHFELQRNYYYQTGQQHGHHPADAKGHPVRDWESTTYVCGFMPSDEFGPYLRQEALRRGYGTAAKVVLLIDGAAALENMGRLAFKDCLQIVDFYHVMEHAGVVLDALLGPAHPERKSRLRRWAKRMLKAKVETLIAETRQACAGQPQAAAVEKALHYFVNNVSRMQYASFRKAHYFIGSGVVEAGCKTVIDARCKQSGMFWSEPGAQNILALRCINRSARLDQFWKYRLNDLASTNDVLPLKTAA